MAIEVDLKTFLLGKSAVTDIVGTRIYIDLSPQAATLPRLVLRLMPGANREYHAGGASSLVFADIEATIQGVYATCHTVYSAIKAAIEVGDLRQTWNGTTVDAAKISPPFSRPGLPVHGDERGTPALVATVETAYRE